MLYLERESGTIKLRMRPLSPFWSRAKVQALLLALFLHSAVFMLFPIAFSRAPDCPPLPPFQVVLERQPRPVNSGLQPATDEEGYLLMALPEPPRDLLPRELPLPTLTSVCWEQPL